MRVLYLHQQFTTHRGSTGNRSYEFAKYLVGQGHEVFMICSGVDNEPRLTLGRAQRSMRTTIDGIHCVPIRAAVANPQTITRQSGVRRMLGFLRFVRLAKQVGRGLPRPDVVFASHVPLTIGLAGMDLAKHFNVPLVFEVRDLWPQGLINLGLLKNWLVIAWLRRMERRIYAASKHVVALSPGIKDGILLSGVVQEQDVTVISNGCDLDLFDPKLDRTYGRHKLGLNARVAAIYFGAIGQANGLEYIVEAARILQDRGSDHVAVVFVGGGGRKAALEQEVAKLALKNVMFFDPVPRSEVAKLVAGCDICMTIIRPSRDPSWSPNKMFDAMAAGRPIVINVPGWLGETVEASGCGCYVDPANPQQLADALERLADDPALRQEMGRNSRALAEREFSRQILAGKLENVLTQAVVDYQSDVRGRID